MSGVLGFIHDGYSLSGFICEVPRLHPALRFKYRAILAQNRAIIFREMDKVLETDPRRAETISAEAMRAQLIEWDLKDKDGKPVEITTSNMLRVQPALGVRLFRILMGREAPDEDPATVAQERDAEASQALALALTGAGPEDADAKN